MEVRDMVGHVEMTVQKRTQIPGGLWRTDVLSPILICIGFQVLTSGEKNGFPRSPFYHRWLMFLYKKPVFDFSYRT